MHLKETTIKKLNERGVQIEDIAKLVLLLQEKYIEGLSLETCIKAIDEILNKREIQLAVLTGIQIDELAERGLIDEPLSSYILNDDGLYGVDETIALAIVNVYGSIGFTNFGYIDKLKPQILGEVDRLGKTTDACHTFLDDIIGALAAAGASKIAHNHRIDD